MSEKEVNKEVNKEENKEVNKEENKKLHSGVIAAIIIGVLVIIFIGLIIYFNYKNHKTELMSSRQYKNSLALQIMEKDLLQARKTSNKPQ